MTDQKRSSQESKRKSDPSRKISFRDDMTAGDHVEVDKKFEELYEKLNTTKNELDRKVDEVDDIDLTLNVITYQIYKNQSNFKTNMDIIREEKKSLLLTDLTASQVSLQMGGLEDKITELQSAHEEELFNLNQQKIELQEQYEGKIILLDIQLEELKKSWLQFKENLQAEESKVTILIAQFLLKKYGPMIDDYEIHISNLSEMQATGWKIINSEIKLAALLEGRGIKITKSGQLLTKTGEHLSYEEALNKGLFDGIDFPISKIYPYIRRLTIDQELKSSIESDESSEVTTVPRMCSEDITYLQENVGTPLTLALAEITSVQPRDPIHYLAHWLFKYRYNQELDIVQKQEIEDLNTERERIGTERWHKFVEEEARKVLLDIIANLPSFDALEVEGEGGYDDVNLDYLNLFGI